MAEKSIGIVKEVDNLGRIVIPKELRQLYKLTSQVELVTTEAGVLMRNPQYKLVEIDSIED